MFFFFQAEDGIRDKLVTGVQTCALPISLAPTLARGAGRHDRDARRRARPRLGVLAVLAVSARTGASRLDRRERMMEVSRSRALPVVLLGTLIVSGCVLSPPAGTLVPPRVEVLAAGERLLARVDDGGLTHLYAFGPGMITLTPEDRLVVEAAWRALQPH